VLGQSHSDGWTASGPDGSLGDPELVDGYANGWFVRPPPGGGDLEFSLRWRPQRAVWFGLVLSAVALVACLALAILAPGRRRFPGTGPGLTTFPGQPRLGSPLLERGRRPPWPIVAAGVLAAGGVAALAVRPVFAPTVAALALVALVWRRGRALLTVGAVAALGIAAAYVVALQHRYRYPADFAWPDHFHRIHTVAWLAVILLGTDVLVERLRERERQPPKDG
jgi:arabinofuranan 3-O-arabinosyltransferase